MSLSTRDLDVFLTIFETKNLSRSAERLGLTQPALSMALKRLESFLGVSLFLRRKQGLEPTKPAVLLAQEARKFGRELETLRQRLTLQNDGLEGTYTLGFHPQIASYVFPRFAPKLLAQAEKLNLHLVFGNSRRVLSDVVAFKVDFGIVVDPVRHPDLVVTKLYENTVGFWTHERPTELQDLDSPSCVVFCDRELVSMEELLSRAFRQRTLTSRRIVAVPDLDVVREFCARGLGIGVLPATIAQKHKTDRLRPLPKLPSFAEQICLVYRADAQKTQAAKFLRSMIVEAFRRPS